MRAIKFRAWISKHGCFHNSEDSGIDQLIDWVDRYEGGFLEQFTGLLDKNGKEIYEGDILECRCGFQNLKGEKTPGESISLYEVRWNTDEGMWGRISEGKFELLSGLNREYLAKWYTIIGNIHENPEL